MAPHSFYLGAFALVGSAAASWITCDGTRMPNKEDCDQMVDWLAHEHSGTVCSDGNPGYCELYSFEEGNCLVEHCFASEDSRCIAYQEYIADWMIIYNDCVKDQQAGGKVANYDDASYTGFYNVQGSANAALYELPEGREAKIPLQSNGLTKRADDDTSYNVVQHSTGIEKGNARYQVTGKLPSGSSFTTTESQSKSTSTTISTSISAGIEGIVSASIGTDVSESHSVSSSVGVTVNIDCDDGQSGVLYWYPTFDYYLGTLEPSGDPLEIWIPLDDGSADYRVECVG